ncbi:hypothetical protein PPSIR1_25271 [Plesiocystis pacifica SIR-1]|uniref:Uncharacterized protein n=1 Tax=Plesiocystis pacifica SIR-1 TaxID=391625 RepID=A6FZ68_9BACT|nr:hypothetical protein [Plesiocystis pacifica]EDM80952.1 hypothetical protein PPSIR1_25271 [Plesiocystis pacifica SIR-1]
MDVIVLDGDAVVFEDNFSGAMLDIPQDGSIKGSGFLTIEGAKTCVEGDEKTVMVSGVMYKTAAFSIQGSGMITLEPIDSGHLTSVSGTGGKPMILVGGPLKSKFTVLAPAQQPNPPGPNLMDNTLSYKGSGEFSPANEICNAE